MVQTVKRGLWEHGFKKGHTQDWNLQLPWLAMGYRFNQQASLTSFSLYFLLFARDPELPTSICHNVMTMINFNDPSMWILACGQHVFLFRHVMPMAMENIIITRHQNILWYATIHGGGYRPQVCTFEPKDYVYL